MPNDFNKLNTTFNEINKLTSSQGYPRHLTSDLWQLVDHHLTQILPIDVTKFLYYNWE